MADQRQRFRLPWLVSAPAVGRPAVNRPATSPSAQDAPQPPPSVETARPPLPPVRVVNPPPLAPSPPPPTAETEPKPVEQTLQLSSPPQLPPPSTLPPPTATTQPQLLSSSEPQSQVASEISSPTQMDQPPPTATTTQVAPPPPPSMSQPAQVEPLVPSSPSQISSSSEKTITEPTLEPRVEVLTQKGELDSSSYQKPSPGVGQEVKNNDRNQPSPQEIEQTVLAPESESNDQVHTKTPDGETMLLPVQEDRRSDDATSQKPIPESERELTKTEERIQSEQDIIDERSKYPTHGELNQKVETNLFSKRVNGEAKEVQDPNPETMESKDVSNATVTHQKFSEPAMPTYQRVNRPPQKSAIPTREKAPFQREIKEDMSKLVHKFGTGQTKQSLEDKPFSVITLAGENKGASMQLGLEKLKREGSIRIERGYRSNPDDGIESTTDGEGRDGRKSRGEKVDEEPGTKAYINSNVQSINNSLVFNSSVNETNPGVQLLLSQLPSDHDKPNKDAGASETEAHKAKSTVAPATKLTYALPTVRRRCLRGLFLESSDSDQNNPEKPQRHGCRYERREKNSGETDDL